MSSDTELNRPVFSIVIPTRNRAHLLEFALRSVLGQESFESFEVVVSDNCSVDGTQGLLATFASPRLRVVGPPSSLPMAEHWEFAVSQARGQYVSVLCDDDALCPHALAVTYEALRETGCKLVVQGTCQYSGNTSPDRVRRNSVAVPGFQGCNRVFPSDRTRKKMADCRSDGNLPLMLNSFCHRDVLEQARGKAGKLFIISPDYSFALMALAMVDKWCFIERPLRLVGVFAESTGVSFIQNRGQASTVFLRENRDLDLYANCILKIPLVTNGLANTYLECKKRLPDELREFTVEAVEYYTGCWEDICRLRSNGVAVDDDLQQYHAALATEPDEVRWQVARRNRAVVPKMLRTLRWLAYRSRLLFKLGMYAQQRGWAYWGDDCGFQDILEASRFVGRNDFANSKATVRMERVAVQAGQMTSD